MISDDVISRYLTAPYARFMDLLRNRVADVNRMINVPAAYDQYPGRRVPCMYSRLYGPLPLTAARRASEAIANGFENLADVANPSEFATARQGNIFVGRDGDFVWEQTAIFSYVSWTYSVASVPNYLTTGVHAFATEGDIYDRVVDNNGGAVAMNNNRYRPADCTTDYFNGANPIVSFDIGLFDRKRGVYLHDGDRLPMALFSGQTYENRINGAAGRFELGSEIEPRLFINEIRHFQLGPNDFEDDFEATQFRAYAYVVFMGYREQSERRR